MDDLKNQFVSDAGQGFETIESQDYTAPWLVLLQTNSPQLKEGSELYVPDARPGRIFSINSGQCYRECHVIPIRYVFRNVEWRPRKLGGGFISSFDRSNTPSDVVPDPLTGLPMRNGNEIKATGYYLCLLQEENWDKVILPLTSTQLKKSRRWNSLMVAQRYEGKTLPIFANVYKLSVTSESNQKGSWFGWKIEWDHILTDKQLYNQAKEIHQTQVEFLPTLAIAYNKMNGTDEEPI